MGRRRTFKTAVLVAVNEHILDAARDSITQEQTWEFFCECGRPDCQEHVALSIADYTALRELGEPVLGHGHRLSRAERARRRSAELRDDAEALRAQAAQQVRRAQKRSD